MPIKEHKVSLLLSKLLHTHHSYDGLHTYSSPMLSSMEHGHMTHKLRVARSLLIHGSTFSWSRASARMQLRVDRLGNMCRESKLRAQRKMREWLGATQTVPSSLSPSPSSQPPLAQSSAHQLSSSTSAAQQLPVVSAAASKLVNAEDAVFGHDGLLRHVLLKSVASLSSAFMQHWNTTEVLGSEHMEAALNRPQGQGLITVCNHVAAMDDPLVMATLVPPQYFDQPSTLRWTLCATDRCFKYAGLSQMFTAMKVLPVQRGAGMQQPGMAAAESRVAAGDWVHVFPEGTRSRNPSHMNPLRKGVGRLVAEAVAQGGPAPLVVPFVHAGMESVMPVGRVLPCTGQTVQVVVGKPIAMDDLLAAAKANDWADDALYTAITKRIESRMRTMHASLYAQEIEMTVEEDLELSAASRSSAIPSTSHSHAALPQDFTSQGVLHAPSAWGVALSPSIQGAAQQLSPLASCGLLGASLESDYSRSTIGSSSDGSSSIQGSSGWLGSSREACEQPSRSGASTASSSRLDELLGSDRALRWLQRLRERASLSSHRHSVVEHMVLSSFRQSHQQLAV